MQKRMWFGCCLIDSYYYEAVALSVALSVADDATRGGSE